MRKVFEKLWVDNDLYVGERYLGVLDGKNLWIVNDFHITPKKCREIMKKYTISNPDANCSFEEALEEA